MIKVMKTESGRTAPVIVCDQCGTQIQDARMALVMWRKDHGVILDDGKIHHVHKACHDALEGDSPINWASSELTAFLRRIASNTNADTSDNPGTELLDKTP